MSKQYRVGCKALDEFGRGIVTFNNKKFAVPYLLPDEKGNIELVYKAAETGAKLVSVDEASTDRVTPVCPVYEKCGGCQLMHMNYEAQLKFKQGQIEVLFPEEAASGKLLPILSMKEPYHYRHKVYASFSKGVKGEILAGIYEENSHRVVRTKSCSIQNKQANRIIETVAALMKKRRIEPYNEDRGTGILRHVYIRIGEKTGQVMVVLVTGSREFPGKKQFAEELLKAHPEITTVIHNINDKKTSMVLGAKETVLTGKGYVEDILCGFTFRISPKSFYQVNPVQTERLYETAVSFAGLTGKETVLDAYCGIGTISLVASKAAGRVVGVELNADAVRDAKENAARNSCNNAEFVCGDAGEYMTRCTLKPEVVFMDPPRSGSDEKFLTSLIKASPKKIVYISCNPQTQKRDVDFLKKSGYAVEKIQAVDCFCQTWHVETVVLLSQQKPDDVIEVEIELDELDLTSAESKATYAEIKDYVLKEHGLKVSNLYISQVKNAIKNDCVRKCGIEVGENYNLPKSEGARGPVDLCSARTGAGAETARQPQCPEEKEKAIRDALEHFGMI